MRQLFRKSFVNTLRVLHKRKSYNTDIMKKTGFFGTSKCLRTRNVTILILSNGGSY